MAQASKIDYSSFVEGVETAAAEVAAANPLPIHRRQAVDTPPPAAHPAATEKWRPGRKKVFRRKADIFNTVAAMAAGIIVALLIAGVAVYAAAPLSLKEAPSPAPTAEVTPPPTAPKAVTDRLTGGLPPAPAPQGGSPEMSEKPKSVTTVKVKVTAPAPQAEEPPPVFGPAPLQEPPPAAEAPAPAEPEEEVAKPPRSPAKPAAKPAPAPKAEAPYIQPGTEKGRIPVKLEKKGPVQCVLVALAQPKGRVISSTNTWKLCGELQVMGSDKKVCERGTNKLYGLEGYDLRRNGYVATSVTNLGSCK